MGRQWQALSTSQCSFYNQQEREMNSTILTFVVAKFSECSSPFDIILFVVRIELDRFTVFLCRQNDNHCALFTCTE